MKCYKAKWILTSTDQVLEDMAIVVDEGKIIDIIPNSEVNFDEKYVKDLGNSVITPGFIDLFTQYQFTDIRTAKPQTLKNKLKRFFKTLSLTYNFVGVSSDNYSRRWATILRDYFTLDRNEKVESFKNGVVKSIKAGTTCFAQVSKEYKYFEVINKLPVKNYLFFEVFADSKQKSKKKFKELRAIIEDLVYHKGENTHIGVMLHSISGVHKKLWELFSKYCRKHNVLLMTRFLEAQDEVDWLEHGFSDIDLLHKFMGFKKVSPYEKGLTSVEYLSNLKVLTKKIIVANANYATEEELEQLAQTGAMFVYQPKYDDEICSKKLPIETILRYFDKKFGFSSQSFCPNNDFSLLKIAANANKDGILGAEELIKYLTIYPARILRLDGSIGTIEKGKDADFNVFKLFDGESYKDILKQEFPYATYSKGRKLVKNGELRFSL